MTIPQPPLLKAVLCYSDMDSQMVEVLEGERPGQSIMFGQRRNNYDPMLKSVRRRISTNAPPQAHRVLHLHDQELPVPLRGYKVKGSEFEIHSICHKWPHCQTLRKRTFASDKWPHLRQRTFASDNLASNICHGQRIRFVRWKMDLNPTTGLLKGTYCEYGSKDCLYVSYTATVSELSRTF